MRSIRTILFCWIVLTSVWNSPAALRPNVLFLLTDDHRADAVQALGNKHVDTPNLNSLVQAGFVFRRAYCMGSMQGAVCVPSRAMLMTGRSLFRATSGPTSGEIPSSHTMMPEVFRAAGYNTIGVGKWHNDRKSFARAFSKGGPVFFGGMSNHSEVPVYDFDPEGNYSKEKQYVTNVFSSELFANAAVQFLREKQERPFFMYVAFTAPHDPRTPPESILRRYSPRRLPLPKNFLPEHPFDNGELKVRDELLLPWPRTKEAVQNELAAYYAMITHLDAQIGRILRALEEGGQGQNTIIVFAGDHGLALGSHGLLGKQNLYEHSVRAPLVLFGPGIPESKRTEALCYLYDLYPTLCELAGLQAPKAIDGMSLVPVLKGRARQVRDEIFCAYRNVQRSIQRDDLKLIHYPELNKYQLFNLKNDPDEVKDLFPDPKYNSSLVHLQERLLLAAQKAGDSLRVEKKQLE
jgi:arylsulfatase A-like enzyme